MLMSPEMYVVYLKDKKYKELLKERDSRMEAIRAFENDKNRSGEEWMIKPSPEVIYQCNLQYLAKICELIAETYNRVYVWGEEEEEQ